MSKRRATIAKRLVEAQHTAAMLTTFNEVDMTAVQSLRARARKRSRSCTASGWACRRSSSRAAVGALKAFPRINAEVQGDEDGVEALLRHRIAVGASSGWSCRCCAIADQLTFWEIEASIKDYARRAEDGTLALDEIKGGTFTITNGGVFGSLLSTPILNPPQVGILGCTRSKSGPWPSVARWWCAR